MVALKICGLVRAEDLQCCRALGVGAVGLNLWPGSPRGRTIAEHAAMLAAAGAASRREPLRVGVFVDPPVALVCDAIAALGLAAVQLHGDADPAAVLAAVTVPWIRVVRGTPPLHELRASLQHAPPPAWLLLDAKVEGYGGQGVATDWAWAAAVVAALAPLPVWLAGGIHPGNAAAAIAAVAPAGLDVASGAEAGTPVGAKDCDAIAALVRACAGG
ncbi:MAG: phosphoribosylanthranilate isomerase [Nannocystaceae bacterium]|nr:phosphoribosylanthranilate isomerase [Nannocystaceae bacterium]